MTDNQVTRVYSVRRKREEWDSAQETQETQVIQMLIAAHKGRKRSLLKEQEELVARINSLTGEEERERQDLEEQLINIKRRISEIDTEIVKMQRELNELRIQMIDEPHLSKKFNKTLCIQNIRYLLPKKKIRLGDIEKASGNSPGYLSRLEKPGNTTDPSIEFLMNAAEMLGVGIDALVNYEMSKPSPNDELLLSFIGKLMDDTRSDTLYWIAELASTHSIIEKTASVDGDQPHILYKLHEENDPETGKKTALGWFYSSQFYPDTPIIVDGISYHSVINDNGDEIYIMNCKDVSEDTVSREPFFEMYHIDHLKEVHAVYCTRFSKDRIASELEQLYKLIKGSQDHVRLSDSTKNMMLGYL